MPRKNRLRGDAAVMGGHPADDQSWNEGLDDADEPDEEGAGGVEPPRQAQPDRVKALEDEIAQLKRRIPPDEPPRSETVAAEDEMTDEEFDALLFSNPREALRLNNERVKKELRTEYTTNQGTNKFWDQFYAANGDLKEDDDLVQSTLQKNMAELGNMPVDKAQNRLAELTRDRILGFMKKRKEPRTSRAVVEGSNPPTIPQVDDADDEEKPATTMSQMLKGRRAIRRRAAQAA